MIVLSTVLVALVACCSGRSTAPTARNGSQLLSLPSMNVQYHSQDTAGNYEFGYSNDKSSKSESRSSDGSTRGHYSYVDPEGLLHTVHYEAGKDMGFRVNSDIKESLVPGSGVELAKKIDSPEKSPGHHQQWSYSIAEESPQKLFFTYYNPYPFMFLYPTVPVLTNGI